MTDDGVGFCRHITLLALDRVCVHSGCHSTAPLETFLWSHSLAIDPILIYPPLKLPAQVPLISTWHRYIVWRKDKLLCQRNQLTSVRKENKSKAI